MPLENLLTVRTTIRGEIFYPLYSCVYGLLSTDFNSYSSRCHKSSSLPPLHWSRVKLIPLRYGIMTVCIIEMQTNKPLNCYNLLWLLPSHFCSYTLINYKWCCVFPHFFSSTKVKILLCCDVPSQGPGVLIGSLIFRVESLIPRYVQYVSILYMTTYPSSYNEEILLILSIQFQKSAANFPSLVIFETHGRLGEYLGYS